MRALKCPECKTEFSWYTSRCSKCGKDLEDRKSYKGSFDSSVFKDLKK